MIPAPPGRAAGRGAGRRWALPALLATYALLAGVYSLATPIFEGPDEIWHFAFASYLADGGGLPVLSAEHPNLLLRNAAHPPLYFLPVAALIAPIDRGDFPASFRFNLASPSITPGSHSDRPNLLIHGRNEDFPYRQSVLAVHVGRLVSIVLGLVTLAGVWVVARLMAPAADERLALATVAVAAFIPQFVYGSAMINNDALAAAGGTWTLAALLALVARHSNLNGPAHTGGAVETSRRDVSRVEDAAPPRRYIDHNHRDAVLQRWREWRWAVLSGLALGVTLLSKIGMVALAPLPLVALGLSHWHVLTKDDGRTPLKDGGQVTNAAIGIMRWSVLAGLLLYGVAGAVAGWWYARNWVLYGDPLAVRVWQVLAGVGRPTPTPAQFLSDMAGLFGTFWADFGMRVDRQWSWAFAGLVLLALAGWVRRLARRDWAQIDGAGLLLALGSFGLLLASAIRYSLDISDIHGRLLHPAIAVVAFGLVVGLASWGRRLGASLVAGAAGGLFVITLLVPFTVIRPAYARPVLAGSGLPDSATTTSARFGDLVELAGYQLLTPRVNPGQGARLVTYWRSLALRPRQIGDLRADLALIRPDGQLLGHSEVLLGSSVYPSSEWTSSDIVLAEFAVAPASAADLPVVAAIWLSVRGSGPVALPTGSDSHLVLGNIALSGPSACAPAVHTDVTFGGLIRLLGYRWDGGRLTLCWSALQAMAVDYTVFVHIIDRAGRAVTTADGQPRTGLYPTSAWLPGEVVADERSLTLPAGDSVRLGLYRLDTGERLTLADTGETEIAVYP